MPDLPPSLDELVRGLASESHVVWLAGSYARGDHARYSDVDLGVIRGQRAALRLEMHGRLLVSIATTTVEATAASFRNPALVGAAVPGWRRAVLLHDPRGLGAALQAEATEWTWERLAVECNSWVAAQTTLLAERALKLLNAIRRGDMRTALVCGNALTSGIPLMLSVHGRLLYDSESRLISKVAEALGEEWQRLYDEALGRTAAGTRETLTASLRLWQDALSRVGPCLSPAQAEVTGYVSNAIRQEQPSLGGR